MRGTLYGVGVGPGDPELLTQKAVRLIRECAVVAIPGKEPRASVAYQIAAAAVPELAEKELLAVDMPMVTDRARLAEGHRRAAALLSAHLAQGRDVAFLTLGDPTVYSTFSYLQRLLTAEGCPVTLVPGVTSFCAAAARLGLPLTEWDQPLHILPAAHRAGESLPRDGTCVLMKSGGRLPEVKALLKASRREVTCVENCGMASEKIYRGVDAIPDDAGYFSLIIAKSPRD